MDATAPGGVDEIARQYDEAFYRAGIARKALTVIDEAIYSLRLQRKALEAEVRVKEHAFADFLVAHPEVKEINERRRAARPAASASPEAV